MVFVLLSISSANARAQRGGTPLISLSLCTLSDPLVGTLPYPITHVQKWTQAEQSERPDSFLFASRQKPLYTNVVHKGELPDKKFARTEGTTQPIDRRDSECPALLTRVNGQTL